MYASRIIFIILIVFGLLNNFRFQFLRIPSILIWALIPTLYIFISNNYQKINKRLFYNYVVPYFILTIILLFPILYNINDFEFEFSGASVEKITAFLTPFSCATFIMLSSKSEKFSKCLNDAVNIGVWLIIVFFIFEAIYRYYIAPEFFLNYFDRHTAKTIGLLSTTNVNGQVLTLLFISLLLIPFKNKFFTMSIILILLITSMARAAIVSLLIVSIIYLISRSNYFFKVIFIISSIFLFSFILYDFGLIKDGSLLSKIEFISATKLIIENSNLTQLFFGFGMSYESITSVLGVQGWSPHLPFLKAFLYYGILGILYYIGTIYLLYRFNNKILLPMFAYLILSLAGGPIFFPGLLSTLIIISKNE